MSYTTHAALTGRLVIIGCGSIGQAVLPLVFRHLAIGPDRVTVVTGDRRGADVAAQYGVRFVQQTLTPDNYDHILTPLLGAGDFLLNLSVDVGSVALVRLARAQGALYLDTCIEPWAGAYTDPSLTTADRSNYALREGILALGRELGAGPTAVIAQGANPGLVSQLVKAAALKLAADLGRTVAVPTDRQGWARLVRDLGVKAIHIAERDTQIARLAKRAGEFVNTWSVDGFLSEGIQPAELGWGTHERHFPAQGRRHANGCGAAIYLERPGAATRVRTWTPAAGSIQGFLVTHNEAISIADYLTLRAEGADERAGSVTFRPTVHYAYHPCDDAVLSLHELAGRNWAPQVEQRLMMDEIESGIDELGVLLLGHAKGAFWYGSQLSIEEARALCPHNNATSLQVAAGVLGGMVCAIERPEQGVVEAEDLDHARVLAVATPYLGPVIGAYSDWTPLDGRGRLFAEDLDLDDPWQFKNVLVA